MANLPESSTFDAGVYQLETTDPVIGGPSGVSNTPLKNLANRTKYLKDHVDALESTRAPLASPAFTGTPTAPTQGHGDNSTKLATTAFVNAEIANDAAPISHVGSTGAAHGVATNLTAGFMSGGDKSKLDGIATDAAAVGSSAPLMDGTAAAGTAATAARSDHVHPTDTTRAPLASPAFTGTPTAPTPQVGVSSQQIANMSAVIAEIVNQFAAAGRSSMADTGYQKLPNGMILQWGRFTIQITSANAWIAQQVTFPIAFPNACLFADGTERFPNGTPGSSPGIDQSVVSSMTTTGYTHWVWDVGQTGTCSMQYFALGY